MKKLISGILAVMMAVLFCAGGVGAEEAPEAENGMKDLQEYLWELDESLSDAEYRTRGIRNFKFVQSIGLLVEEESYKAYSLANTHLKQKKEGAREEFIEAQNQLILNTSVADGVYFLWEEGNVPCVDGEEYTEEELDKSTVDAYGTIPLVVKCLLDDPAQAKGNLILVLVGAWGTRADAAGAYPAVKVFKDLGYNVFILQCRVRPYSNEDIFMDTQRSIRLVRYYAEKEGWGGQDMIAACGWSGGGNTIMGTINHMYGYGTAADYCSSYVPDEIDTYISDLDAALTIYSDILQNVGIQDYCENPHIPAMYCCAGSADTMVGTEGEEAIYETALERGAPALLNIIEGAGHGFGVGASEEWAEIEGCSTWPMEADEFMMANKGRLAGLIAAEEQQAAEGE